MPEPGPDDAARAEERPRRRKKRRSWARRKHLGLITIASVLVVLAAGVLLVVATWDNGRESFDRQIAAAASSAATAAPSEPTAGPTTTPTPTAAATSAVPGTATTTTVRGAITAVGDDSWTLAGNNGLDYTVMVTADTQYTGRRTFTSFDVGDAVTVKGTLDRGTVTAQAVNPATPAT